MPSFGDTPSVQVPIVARDETSAAFASATANVQRFAAQTTGAGTAMDYSMREARGGIMLLGEEIGVKLNRHVAGFLANLAPIGGAMSLAFAPLAIVNLIQLAEMLAEKFTKVSAKTKELAEEQKKLYEQVNKGLLAVGKSDVETAKQLELVGATGARKLAIEYGQTADELAKNRENFRAVSDAIYGLSHGMEVNAGDANKLGGELLKLNSDAEVLRNKLKVLDAQWKFESAKEGADNLQKATDKARELAKQYDAIVAAVSKLPPSSRTGFDRTFPAQAAGPEFPYDLSKLGSPSVPLYSGTSQAAEMYKLEHDQAYRLQEIGVLYNETRTRAEQYAFELSKLAVLYKDKSAEDYKRALSLIKQKYDDNTIAVRQFGTEVGEAMKQGILMGRGWDDVLKTVLVDVIELIAKMTILKKLNQESDEGGGGGGFFGALLGGLFGGKRASGGPVSEGSMYLVGERGPELFTPSTSGMIIPGGMGPNVEITQYYDFSGSDSSIIPKVQAMLQQQKRETVELAVAAMRERSLRS